jgi:DNA-binding IclR family transcriptional regulator
MTRPELPANVRRFILTSVPSVPYLEAVLLLRAEPATAWGVAELARRLYVPERTATELLQLLTSSGIAAPVGDTRTARYAPAAELRGLLEELAQSYSTDLVAITDLIHSRIDRRAQRFADAFRFRKE